MSVVDGADSGTRFTFHQVSEATSFLKFESIHCITINNTIFNSSLCNVCFFLTWKGLEHFSKIIKTIKSLFFKEVKEDKED